jgi:Putative prokaryotic signal transducing protein
VEAQAVMDEPERSVFLAHGETEAQQVCAFLRASGIRARVRGESLRNLDALTVGRLSAVEILVSQADEDEARKLLQSVEAGEFHLGDDVETDS